MRGCFRTIVAASLLPVATLSCGRKQDAPGNVETDRPAVATPAASSDAREELLRPSLSNDYIRTRTCWLKPIGNDSQLFARQVVFQLWLNGLDHKTVASTCDKNNPIELPAVASFVDAVLSDWSGASQMVALTGVNGLADTTADKVIQQRFAQMQYVMNLSEPNPIWSQGSVNSEEFAFLATPQWTVVDDGVEVIGQSPSGLGWPATNHYNEGLDVIGVTGKDVNGNPLAFHVFMTHFGGTGPAYMPQQLKAALDYIGKFKFSPSEYAPLLIGDFNTTIGDARLSSWFLSGPQGPANAGKVACVDGIGAHTTVGNADGDMDIFVGTTGPGTPFAHMRGSFVALRRSFGVVANSNPAMIQNPSSTPGIVVPGICHGLIGYAFGTQEAPPPECQPPKSYCAQSNTCVNKQTDHFNCGWCNNSCPVQHICSGGQCVFHGSCLPDGDGCGGPGASCCGTCVKGKCSGGAN